MKFALATLLAATLLVPATVRAYADEIVIQPEQETVIHEYVVKHPADAVEAPSDYDLSVGNALPDTIRLVPVDVPESRYDYATVGKRTVIVERGTRRVVHIYD